MLKSKNRHLLTFNIRNEVFGYLINKTKKYQSINILKHGMEAAEKENLLTREHICDIFSYIFSKTIINN